MNNYSTPKVLRSTAKIPDTPALERIGYGTGVFSLVHSKCLMSLKLFYYDNLGVGVFNLERNDQSPWAAKIISRHTGRDRKQFSNRLQLEAKLLSSLNHPNIIGYRALVKRPDGREVCIYEL